jgi:hypothetical protein
MSVRRRMSALERLAKGRGRSASGLVADCFDSIQAAFRPPSIRGSPEAW